MLVPSSQHLLNLNRPHFRPPAQEADWTNALLDNPTIMNGMTVRINSSYTKIIFTKRSPLWSLETSEFSADGKAVRELLLESPVS